MRKPCFSENRAFHNRISGEITVFFAVPETIQKLPETTETSHIIVFLLKISYSQVEFVLILHPRVLFGQTWSHKLKFSKLTKTWYRGTLLYPHFEFNVYFSKFLSLTFFLGKFGPKIWSSPSLLKFGTGAHCYIHVTILKFIFPKFCHSCFLDKFGPIIWISSNWLKFRRGVHFYILFIVLIFLFFFKILFVYIF